MMPIPDNSTVSYACKCISQKIDIPENQIFLVSQNENQFFYNNNVKMFDVIKENPEYIIYSKIISIDQKNITKNLFELESNLTTKYKKHIKSNRIPINVLLIFKNFKYIDQTKNDIYKNYAKSFNKVPDDLQQKVNEIAVLGFEIEDIKEALRSSEYNVLFAINSLVSRSSGEIKRVNYHLVNNLSKSERKTSINNGNNKANYKIINNDNDSTNTNNLETGNNEHQNSGSIKESNKKIMSNNTKNITESKDVIIANSNNNDNQNSICEGKANSNEKVRSIEKVGGNEKIITNKNSSTKYSIKSFNNETNTLNKPNISFNGNKFGSWNNSTNPNLFNDKGKCNIKQVSNSNNNDDKQLITADITNSKQLTNSNEDNNASVNKIANDSNNTNIRMQLHKTFSKTEQKNDSNCTGFSFYHKSSFMNANNNTSNSLSNSKLTSALNNSTNESHSLSNPYRKKLSPWACSKNDTDNNFGGINSCKWGNGFNGTNNSSNSFGWKKAFDVKKDSNANTNQKYNFGWGKSGCVENPK